MADAPEYQTVYLTLQTARALKPGDIIENVYYMFWHPYVVESAVPHNPADPMSHVTVRVVHYGRKDLWEGISVLQENLTLDAATAPNFRFYRLPEEDCRPVEEVVGLARSRIGEAQHNILWNNATYFALSCKLTDSAFERYKQVVARVRPYNPWSQE